MVVDPSGVDRTTTYGYNADNDVTSQATSSPAGTTAATYTYDLAGDKTSQTINDGSSGNLETSWTYDQQGLPLTETTPLGNVSGGTPANYTTTYTYDQAGDLSTVTGPPVPVPDLRQPDACDRAPRHHLRV